MNADEERNQRTRDELDEFNAARFGMDVKSFRAWTAALMEPFMNQPVKPRNRFIHWLRMLVRI